MDLSLWRRDVPLTSYARSATVSIVALLMVAMYPVSGSVGHVLPLAELDASNTGEELVCVPVCIQFHFYEPLSCIISSDKTSDLNHSTALIYSGRCKCHHRLIVSSILCTHDWLHSHFDRYSNTLLVSLNNHIAIRDSDAAHGGFVDCQVMTSLSFRDGAFSEATKSVTLVPERPPKHLKNQLVPKAEIEESVNCESCERHIIVLLFYAWRRSRDCRHCVTSIIRFNTNRWCYLCLRRPTFRRSSHWYNDTYKI